MPKAVFQRLIAILCLLGFGLGQSAVAPLFVRCQDASGKSSIEFACDKTADGSCLTACSLRSGHAPDDAAPCDDEDGDHTPHPCKDTPLGESMHASKFLPRSHTIDPVQFIDLPPFFAQTIVWSDLAAPHAAAPLPPIARPPDAVARLRTIIMIV